MARFEDIKSIINTYIKPNGKEEITGEVLQNVLRAMMEAVDIVVDEVVAAFPQISGSEFVDVLENKVSLLLDSQGHLGNTGRGLGVVMDKVMSDDSLNPVSNKVVKAYVDKIKSDIDMLVGGNLSSAIDNFNEILEFLSSIEDSETLSGIIAGLETALKKYADGVAQAAYEQSYSDSVGASSAYTDGKIAALAAVARTGSYNDLKDKPTIPTGGGGATPRVEMTAASAAIEPNKFYVWPMMDSLDLTLGAEHSGVMNRYLFQFRNPKAGLTMLTLPNDITWSEDTELDENGLPVMEAAAFYRIEIIEGLASLKKWKLVYIQFADAEVERVLMSKGIGDGSGITKMDAKSVTSIGAMFVNNEVVESFEEFKFFTGITAITGSPWEDGGFRGCTNLKKIRLPKSLQTIFAGALPGQYSSTGAFKGCTSLVEIAIPEGVDTIPTSIFYNCKSLEMVVFDGEPKTISDYAFANCENLSLPIPSSVEVIGGSAFSGAPMDNVVIDCPNLAKLSGTWVFTNSKIKGVESLGKITTLTFQNNPPGAYGNYPTFYGCANMEFLNLPETLIHIGRNMFQGCSSLKGITIPSNVGELFAGTFAGCSSVEYIKMLATTPPTIASDCFDSGLAIPIYVPDSSLEAYKTATGWSSWVSLIYPMSSFGSAILPSFVWVNGYWGVGATSIVSNSYYAAFPPKDISDGSVTCIESNTQVRLCVFDSAGKCLARGNNVTSIADIRTACAALSASAVKWSLNFSYVGNSVDGGIAITPDILINIPVDISLTE